MMMTMGMEQGGSVLLTVTAVEYEKGDVLGLGLALATLLPLFIGFSMGVLILVRRDLHTILYLTGIILNEATNYTLKRIIKEPRPPRAGDTLVKYGMPSSHAQFMTFFAIYFLWFIWIRVRPRASAYVPLWWSNLGRVAGSVGACVIAAIVCYSRVYLHYHTAKQVGAGAAVGAVTGTLWFYVVHHILSPRLFPWLASTTIARIFLIRDLTAVDDCLLVEYQSTRQAAQQGARTTKKHKKIR